MTYEYLGYGVVWLITIAEFALLLLISPKLKRMMMMVLHINKTYGIVDETGESVKHLGSAVDAHIWGVGNSGISKIYLATVDNVIIR